MDLFDWKAFLLLLIIFLPLERLLPMHPEQTVFRRGCWNDLIYVVANNWLVKLGAAGLIVAGRVAAQAIVPPSWRDAVAAQPYWLQTAQVLVIADMGFYLVHRSFHAVPWLWQFHGPGARPANPVALAYSEVALAAFAAIYHWHSILLHANPRINFGPLRWLIASPEFHRWHHGDHREAYDKNFAGQFAFLMSCSAPPI